MTDGTRKVKPGDALDFPAQAYNDFVDAATWVKAHGALGGSIKKGSASGLQKTADIVKVRNGGSETFSQFDVVGLREMLFDPSSSDTLPEWKKNPPTFDVGRPRCEDVAKFAVLLEPIVEGEVGLAVISGAVQVLVDIVAETDEFADITPLDRSKLTSVADGSAQIILKESAGTGEKLCLVRLSNAASSDVCVSTSTTSPPTTTGTTSPPTTTGTGTTSPPTTTGTTGTATTDTTTTGTGTTGTGTTGTGTTGTTTTGTGTTGTGTTDTTTTGTGTTGTGTTDTTTTGTGTTDTTTTGTGTTGTGTTGTGTTDTTTTGTTTFTTDTTTTVTDTTPTTSEACLPFDCDAYLCSISFEVVTDVRCVDGEIEVDKATLCLDTSSVDESTLVTTAGS